VIKKKEVLIEKEAIIIEKVKKRTKAVIGSRQVKKTYKLAASAI
jgi:hypothetical protein